MPDAQKRRYDARLLWVPAVLLLIVIFFVVRHYTRPVLHVRVAHVARQSLTRTNSTNGRVEPQHNFAAHAPAAGTIKALFVHGGELVPAGKLLLAMDDADARTRLASAAANVKGAQASLDAVRHGGTHEEQLSLTQDQARNQTDLADAQRNLDTLKKLQTQGAASPSEVQAAQQRLDAARTALQNVQSRKTGRYASDDIAHAQATLTEAQTSYSAAQQVVAESNVRSPFAGTVYSLPVVLSEYVQPGQELLQLADLHKLQVRAYFDEPEIGSLAIGQVAKVDWDAKHGRSWSGHVIQLPSTIISYGTRNVGETLISIDNPDGVLLPNINVTVTVTTQHLDSALTMPREALHTEAGIDYVFLIKGNAVHRQTVTIGVTTLTQVQILSGLQEGDVVATGTANGEPLAVGTPIRVDQ